MDLYKAILTELEKRNLAHVRQIAPFFISSIGTHKFNIINQQKNIWTQAGEVINARQHILFVAPPGWYKSTFLKQFLQKPTYSILNGTSVPCVFENSITGTSTFIGTVNPSNGNISYGLAHEHANGIVGFEEFSAITNAAKTEYAGTLGTDLLTALDSGDVARRVAGKEIRYHTDLTVWGGVQPARFDLSSGLGRRFTFIVFNPNYNDVVEARLKRKEMQHFKPNNAYLKILRDQLDLRFKEIATGLTNVIFTAELYKEIHRLNIIPYEEVIYERLGLGYWLMKMDRIGGDLVVGLDTELKRLIELEHSHRKKAKKGTTLAQVLDILRTMPEREMEQQQLEDFLIEFSLNLNEIKEILQNLLYLGQITRYQKATGSWFIKLIKK